MSTMRISEPQAGSTGSPLKKGPLRLHHHAYTTDDHEATRAFYEDVLGIPLVAMFVEREWLHGEWVELGHAFYGLEDGSALAFFNFADQAKQDAWRAKQQSLFVHVSLLVTQETQAEIGRRLTERGFEPFSIEHGYCSSLYIQDPNGLYLEFTVDPGNAPDIYRQMAASAHDDLARWIRGDRTVNNAWRIDAPEGAA